VILQNWWYTTLLGSQQSSEPPLNRDIESEAVVVGGGAAGLAAALALSEKGIKVVLLERNICGGSSTGKSAGFLTPDSELELAQLVRRFGPEGARELWEAATHGVDFIVSAIKKYDLKCDLVSQDSLFLGNGSGGWKAVQEELEAREALKYKQTIFSREELPKILGSTGYHGGVRYPGTFGINPLLYAQGLKKVLLDRGVKIYESSEVKSVSDHTVQTHLGRVKAEKVIFCSDKLHPGLSRYARNIYHAQTFLSVSEPLGDADIQQLFPSGEHFQCWDSDLVYTYYRLTGDHRLLVGGGSKLSTFSRNDVTTPSVIKSVIAGFKQKFPFLKHLEFIQYWPGRIDTTRDLLPTVLRDEKAPWVSYVLGCVGLPWATFSGEYAAFHSFCDSTCKKHQYYNYFRPSRKFLLPLAAQNVVGKQLLFSINNAWAKYYQVDRN
jgi:gamma-glutamylputrescine oxidase